MAPIRTTISLVKIGRVVEGLTLTMISMFWLLGQLVLRSIPDLLEAEDAALQEEVEITAMLDVYRSDD